MASREADNRSSARRTRDEEIAAEPPMASLDLPADAPASTMEAQLARSRGKARAVAGIVENGVVRPLDPTINLPEHSHVIIVASEETV